jgi:hypothetical protein
MLRRADRNQERTRQLDGSINAGLDGALGVEGAQAQRTAGGSDP